jgi:Uncharacterized homolog of phage Mu protein gp47
MPWTTPTLKTVRGQTRDFVLSALGAVSFVPNSALRIMSDAMSALAHLTMLYLDWLAKQMLPDTAETEFLDRHGVIWLKNADGSLGRKAASFAAGTVSVTGVDGTIVPEGTLLLYGADLNFQTTDEVTVGVGGTVELPVVCLTAGIVGNVDDGDVMTISVDGIDGAATVVEMGGGTDAESDDQLRERILLRIQQPPMGGDASDYVLWALAVNGVTRAWCSPLEMGVGTVTVRFMMDDLRAGNGGFPLQEDVEVVREYLETQRPVAIKDMFVEIPIAMPVDVKISEMSLDTEEVRAEIEDALNAMFRKRAAPAHSTNGVPQPAQTMYEVWAAEAVSGIIDHFHLEMGDIEPAFPGQLGVLGSVIYSVNA